MTWTTKARAQRTQLARYFGARSLAPFTNSAASVWELYAR